jgi:PAS domain S-box-containing protein|nr:PAS domain S-box protein [Kofleriaceae bacterium]
MFELALYQDLFDANPRPAWVFERATLRIVVVNRAAIAMYGWTRDEFLQLTLRDIREPADVPRLEAQIADSNGKTTPYRRASRHRTKDGRSIDVDLEIARIAHGDGRVLSMAVVTDLTGVADVERRFRLLVENCADGITVIGPDRNLQYVSPGAERILGVQPGELSGRSALTTTHPDDIKTIRQPQPGQVVRNLLRNRRHSDGEWRWIESIVTNLTDDPAVRAFVSNFRDVTERVEQARALERWETNFRMVIERMPIATLVHSSRTVRYLNPAAIALLGHDRDDELIGVPVLDLVHADDRGEVVSKMAKSVAVGRSDAATIRMLRRDGSYVEIDAEAVRVMFDGEPASVVMLRDVSERRDLLARMMVADRMMSVGTLAAGVAHELNNPLAYIVSNLAVLADELPALTAGRATRRPLGELATLLADARDGADRMSAIVRDLRALSRSDDRTVGAVDVTTVLAASVKMAHNELRHRARVVQVYDRDLPAACGNASRLGQVFLNLLINAAHAIEEGHADDNQVRVHAFRRGDRIVVDVADTGVGIAPAVVGRIFDPFFTTKPVGVGVGLGLSISHEIVRSFGGSIEVASELGKGSSFQVTLPIATAVAAEEAAPTTPPLPVRAEPVVRVLMIDDEAAVGRSTAMLLAPDFDVTAVTRAADGLARIARGEPFDAILCDLMMPEMSGMEFFQQLRERAPAVARRVVFLTGGAFTPQARAFLAEIDQPHVAKPFEEQDLRRALARVRAHGDAEAAVTRGGTARRG